jgi:hypothetical protein
LTEYAKEIESIANFLIVDAIAIFNADKKAGKLTFNKIDLYWLI